MAACPACTAEVPAGKRWCPICRSNVVDVGVGRLATPGRRLGAYFLDIAVPAFALFLILSVAGLGAATGTDTGIGLGLLLGLGLFGGYLVWALVLFSRGVTPGKLLLGIRVIKEDGQSAGFLTMLGREWLGKAISALVLWLGFLWILLDPDKQGWHDKLMSTYVVQ